MAGKLPFFTTFFRVLQFVWSLIYVIEIGSHTLNNKEYGGKLDYQPLVSCAGLAIASFIIGSVGINAFGIYNSFLGRNTSSRLILNMRVWIELFNWALWFTNVFVVFYAIKLDDIANDPELDAISDTLYWSNPWTIPTLMMNVVLVGLVIAESYKAKKANDGAYIAEEANTATERKDLADNA